MKKLKYILLIIITISITACDESTINLDPVGDTEAGYFTNESQMDAAVLGIYQKMSFLYTFKSQGWLTGIWLLPDDDLTTRGGEPYETFVNLNGSDGRIREFYKQSYQLIARANTVLQKIEENGSSVYPLKPELMNYHKGEALFLKSWMNFMLWNVFGTAPVVPERIIDFESAYPPSSTGTELLDVAITDLVSAIELLPDSWTDEQKGRVTKNSARALAGKILVFRGTVNNTGADFTQAISLFNSISGASLMPGYGDNFDALNENNAESLFEYQSSENVDPNPYTDNDLYSVIGDLSAYYGYYVNMPDWLGSDVYTASESFKAAIESGDPRIEYIVDPTPDLMTNVKKYNRDGIYNSNWSQSWGCNRNNVRILRFSDVLLLKAEAIARSNGDLSEAIGLINQVRERARFSTLDGIESPVPADRNTAETSTETVIDWIFQERRIELCFEEGCRWFDLRRRHLAGEINLATWNFSSLKPNFAFSVNNLYFPIPENEVVLNPNLHQNEGY